MAQIEWIKISTEIFEDPKIKLLKVKAKTNFNSVMIVWFRLLCLAGKQNNQGLFYLSENKPIDLDMFSVIFETPVKTLETAFNYFLEFGMLDKINGVYLIKNWNKHQSLDKYEEKKRKDRERIALKREQQKAELVAQDVADMSQPMSQSVADYVADSRSKIRREEKRQDKIKLDKTKEEESDTNITLTPYEQVNCITGQGLKERSIWCLKNCPMYKLCNQKKSKALIELEKTGA